MAPILRLGVRGGNLGKSSRPFLFPEKRTPFPLFQKGKVFVLFLSAKKKNEKEAASAPLDRLCKKEPRRVRLPHVFLSCGQEIRRSTPQRKVRAAGDLVPCGTDCRRKDRYGVWLPVCRARTVVRASPRPQAWEPPAAVDTRAACLPCNATHCIVTKKKRGGKSKLDFHPSSDALFSRQDRFACFALPIRRAVFLRVRMPCASGKGAVCPLRAVLSVDMLPWVTRPRNPHGFIFVSPYFQREIFAFFSGRPAQNSHANSVSSLQRRESPDDRIFRKTSSGLSG